jgi:hypothetical protein
MMVLPTRSLDSRTSSTRSESTRRKVMPMNLAEILAAKRDRHRQPIVIAVSIDDAAPRTTAREPLDPTAPARAAMDRCAKELRKAEATNGRLAAARLLLDYQAKKEHR